MWHHRVNLGTPRAPAPAAGARNDAPPSACGGFTYSKQKPHGKSRRSQKPSRAPFPRAVSVPPLQAAPGTQRRRPPLPPGCSNTAEAGGAGKRLRGRAEPAAAQGSRNGLRSLRKTPGCRLAALPPPLPELVPTRGPAGRWFLQEAPEHPPVPLPPFRVRPVPGPRSHRWGEGLSRLIFKLPYVL